MVTPAHTVTITFNPAGSQTKKFVCNAPVDALCHATYYCGCESWLDEDMVDGYPRPQQGRPTWATVM